MKFKSKKDLLFSVVILGLNAFLIGITIMALSSGAFEKDTYWSLILILVVVSLLFWLYFGTHYELSKDKGLVYKSGSFRGKINVACITEIIKGKTLWVGLRPVTSRKGLIVKYDKYNEFYSSPKTSEAFIKKNIGIERRNKNYRIQLKNQWL